VMIDPAARAGIALRESELVQIGVVQ